MEHEPEEEEQEEDSGSESSFSDGNGEEGVDIGSLTDAKFDADGGEAS